MNTSDTASAKDPRAPAKIKVAISDLALGKNHCVKGGLKAAQAFNHCRVLACTAKMSKFRSLIKTARDAEAVLTLLMLEKVADCHLESETEIAILMDMTFRR